MSCRNLLLALAVWASQSGAPVQPAPVVTCGSGQFAYRQIMYLVLLQPAATALAGRRLRWQKLRRSGEVAADAA
jgi:hypothetical protein